MSDLSIASAAALTGASLAPNDVLPVLDVSASAGSKGRRITVEELFTKRTAVDLTTNDLQVNNHVYAGSGNALYFGSNGYVFGGQVRLSSTGYNGLFGVGIRSGDSFGWSEDNTSYGMCDLQLCRAGVASLQLGVNHATTPTAQSIKGHDVTTGTGASLTLAGGKGSVAGGAVVLATSATTGTATARLTIDPTGLTTFSGPAFSLVNSAAATAGTQSASPATIWMGHGWKTDASAGSQTVAFKAYAQPVQGASTPSCNLVFGAAINGGSYADVMTIKSGGQIVGGVAGSTTPTFATPNNHGIGDNGTNGFTLLLNGNMVMDFGNDFIGLPYNGSGTLLFGRVAGGGADAYSPQFGREDNNVLAQKNGTNAQALRIYNTFTSATDHERFSVDWITRSNVCTLTTQKGAGSGTLRGMTLGAAAANPLSVYGVTPVVQASAISAPSGGTVQDAEARAAIGALINAIKNFGITA